MALTGNWKDANAIPAGALKWGTGISPVHSVRQGDGRNIAPAGNSALVDSSLLDEYDEDGWSNEPWAVDNHESIRDIGMYDRPNYGDNPQHARGDAGDFPGWGRYEAGLPGGTSIRTHKHGSDDLQTPNQNPTETVSEGWLNKPVGEVNDAVTSDTSQLLMNTSMTQRDKVREGSQRGEGSQDEHRAPIRSRIVGMRLKVYSGGRRHEDMRPKEQPQRPRAFWHRSAGTARSELMAPNAQHDRRVITRAVPPDPYQGQPPAVVDSPNYGYQDEDVIPYA